jgi:hypothetical protein
MSSVPNYVGTTSQVGTVHAPNYIGHNTHFSLLPSTVIHPVAPVAPANSPPLHAQGVQTFVYPAASDQPLHIRQSTYDQVDAFDKYQDKMYRSQMELPTDYAPAFAPGFFDRPTDETTVPYDPMDQYAEQFLKHNELFQMKVMRAPSS